MTQFLTLAEILKTVHKSRRNRCLAGILGVDEMPFLEVLKRVWTFFLVKVHMIRHFMKDPITHCSTLNIVI